MSVETTAAGPHICYFCSAHERFDTRVFDKYCLSSVEHGFKTTLVLADGLGTEHDRGVDIIDVGSPDPNARFYRLKRFIRCTLAVYLKTRGTRADIYHFHDPELLPVSFLLALTGKPVVYDVHEDYRELFRSRTWMYGGTGRILGAILRGLEKLASRTWLAGVVTATERIEKIFPAKKSITIRNFSDLSEFSHPRHEKAVDDSLPFNVVLIGGLMPIRVVRELVDAVGRCRENVRLTLGGVFEPEEYQSECMASPGWERTHLIPGGWVSRDVVADTMQSSDTGIALLQPHEHLKEALPVKMFEYMAAGIPIVASNFPLIENVIREHDIGFVCDPLDPDAIAASIDELAANRNRALDMGRRARDLAATTYSWRPEAERLVALHRKLLPAKFSNA